MRTMRLADLDRGFLGRYLTTTPLLFWVDKTLPDPENIAWMTEALRVAAKQKDQQDARDFSAELPEISGVRATVEVVQWYDGGRMERGILVRRPPQRKNLGYRKAR